jgi:hypothetical protein
VTTKDLLAKGYFAEELPPPFHTLLLASNYIALQHHYAKLTVKEKEKIKETSPVLYSTPKIGIYRRITSLPNPVHQIPLSDIIATNWAVLRTHWNKSDLSASIPIVKKSEKRAIVQISKFQEFKEKCIKTSFDKLYELKADVSKYFPSIYTHSIPWALHTKKIAKLKKFDKTLFGNRLDEAVRFGQSAQTKGIPVGTDTSRIIAEIIGCALDVELKNKFINEKIKFSGYRFIDDYQLYFNSLSDAEKALKILQRLLGEYSLDLSDEKTIINTAPYKIDNDWSFLLNGCPLRDTDPNIQGHDLITYVNLLISTAIQYPNDYVVKYGIKRLLKFKIYKTNWPLLESLILKLGTYEPSILPLICTFLLQNQMDVTFDRLNQFVRSILDQCIYKGQSFEIAWTLWIAKLFSVKIPLKLAQAIIDSRDVISTIILLDLIEQKQIISISKLNLTDLIADFTEDNLSSELWLLIYEGIFKKWITSSAVSASPYFREMSRLKISFYDANAMMPYGDPNIRSDIDWEAIFKELEKATFSGKQKKKVRGKKRGVSIY